MSSYLKTLEEKEKRLHRLLLLEARDRASNDIIYYINNSLYVFNPKVEPYHFKFHLFPFQKDLVYALKKAIEGRDEQGINDRLIEKCREMGATYTVLAVFFWFWRFIDGSNFLIGSRKEDYVDNRKSTQSGELSNKEESLFGKLEYFIFHLNPVMLPKGFDINKHLSYMSLKNPENGNVISGESSNQNFSRGGRQKAILLDEFAFWDNDCYNKDMEILTKDGWKLVAKVGLNDLVYSMNPETEEAELMPIINKQEVYAKKLIHFKSKSVDIMVTSNHKMLVKKRYWTGKRIFADKSPTSKLYFKRADKLIKQNHDFIPLVSEYIGGDNPKIIHGFEAKDWLEFLGWYISKGCFSNKPSNRRINISQRKTVNIENYKQIEALLRRMGIKIRYYNNSEFQISKGFLPTKAWNELICLGKANNKYIPREYLNANKVLLESLFDSLIKGDGCEHKRKNRVDKISYATTSYKLAGQVQEIAQKIGMRGSITKVDHTIKHPKWANLYVVNIGFKQNAHITALKREIIKYNEKAYCVTTPYHTLYVRRNGVASWCGNSAAWGSTADTTNCRIALTTPAIRPNTKAKRLRFGEEHEKIKVITLPYYLDPRKDKSWLDKERERRSTEDFAREIMINWEGSVKGKVYPEIKQAEVGKFPYDPMWSLFVSWDFGLDGVALGWWQINTYNGKLRLVDSYENSNKPIQFYYPLLNEPIDSQFEYTEEDIRAFEEVKHFKKAIHYGDPDVKKRAMQTPTLASNKKELAKIGIHVQTKPASNEFIVRREKTKVLLQRGIEVNQTSRNNHWLKCIKNATYPERDENSQNTSEIVKPIHNWTSHHRTALEYLAVNIELPESIIPKFKTLQERIFEQLTSKNKELDDDILGDFY